MDHLTKFSLDILRDRNFSKLDQEVREEVLSLFIDDDHNPSKEGRKTLAFNAALLAKQLGDPQLEQLSMDVLMACDKTEVREAMTHITTILQKQA